MAFKTPGVYVQEISLFPPSVAEVATAIPAFIGYTEKAEKRGEDLTNKPTKISSLLDYHELFGGAYEIEQIDVVVNKSNNYAVTSIDVAKRFYLYDSLRLFFDNGGGKCYIVSVGGYDIAVVSPGLTKGLKVVEKVDEPTILLFPDATLLDPDDEGQFYTLQQRALSQCAKLQDRVAVFDLFEGAAAQDLDTSVEGFRNGIGINNLKYGAAYTPWLHTTYPRTVDYKLLREGVSGPSLQGVVQAVEDAVDDVETIDSGLDTLNSGDDSLAARYATLKDAIDTLANDADNIAAFGTLLQFLRDTTSTIAGWRGSLKGADLKQDLDTLANNNLVPALLILIGLEKNSDVRLLSGLSTATDVDPFYAILDGTGWLGTTSVDAIPADSKSYYDETDTTLGAFDKIVPVVTDLDGVFEGTLDNNFLHVVQEVEEAAASRRTAAEQARRNALATLTSDPKLNKLVAAANAAFDDKSTIADSLVVLRAGFPTIEDRHKALQDAINSSNTATENVSNFQEVLAFVRGVAIEIAGWKSALLGGNLIRDLDTYVDSTLKKSLVALIAFEKNTDVRDLAGGLTSETDVETAYDSFEDTGWLDDLDTDDDGSLNDIDPSTESYTGPQSLQKMIADLGKWFQSSEDGNLLSLIAQVEEAAQTHAAMAQTTLYQGHPILSNIVESVKRELGRVPPSGAVAGVYAFVDGSRGVWKAPANVSLNAVLGPVVPIDDADQEDLNVDVNAGKSINAIRAFSGLGTLVWGARTLAGNDNEWRYVAVRRFYNMVEESIKKSTSWAVFEPNTANLWTKVKSMIDNYLIQKWREGALAGATPDDAFFVKVGLGLTMTAQDILEGRLNVEIGMAVARPAEFIVLKFSHKLQQS